MYGLSLISIITFIFQLSLIQALPLPTPLEARGISSSQLSQFTLYEQYAAAAYCKDNSDDSTGSITCASGNCPSVQQAGAQSVLEFTNLGETDATGFIAVDNVNKLIVLSYRGSASLANWVGNFNIEFVSFDSCSGCSVHAGFFDGWNDSKDQVKAALAQATANNPGYSIISTGHSLGAAIATLAAAELRTEGYNIALYTYGSPMVGNSAFASFVTGQSGGNYRVTHAHDAVPKLPGYALDYRHVSPEYWVTTATDGTVNTNSVQVSTGTLDLWGNQGTIISTISDHLWYFNSITACTSGFEL